MLQKPQTQLFLTEFGLTTLTICIDVLKEDPPLSPPSLIHISVDGIIPETGHRGKNHTWL